MPMMTGQRRADTFRVWGELTRGKLFRSLFIWGVAHVHTGKWHASAGGKPLRVDR